MNKVTLILGCVLGMGCSTTTTHLSSPHALEPKHIEMTGAYAWQVNGVVVEKSLESSHVLYQQVSEEDRQMTPDEFFGLLDTTLAWSLLTPGGSSEMIGRIGITDKLLEGIDVGFKTDFTAIKTDVKWQLWESTDGRQAVAWNGAYAWQNNVVPPKIEWITNSTFSRHDVETSLMWGIRKSGVAELYAGPRVIYSKINAQPNLSSEMTQMIPEELSAFNPSEYFADERMLYYGGTIGTRLGYHVLFLDLELNCFWVQFEPLVVAQRRDLSGLLVSPTVGLTIVPMAYTSMKSQLELKLENRY